MWLTLGLQALEGLCDQRLGWLPFQVSAEGELPSHLLSWHLPQPRVLL
jgi:hypothetical protein